MKKTLVLIAIFPLLLIGQSRKSGFNPETNNYINYSQFVSFKVPSNWDVDNGISKNTIFRCYDSDSGITFSVNIIEDSNFIGQNDYWKIYEKNQVFIENQMKTMLKNSFNWVPVSFNASKSYLRNTPCVRFEYEVPFKELDLEYMVTQIQYQLLKNDRLYTFTLALPKVFYLINKERYENIFKNVQFLVYY